MVLKKNDLTVTGICFVTLLKTVISMIQKKINYLMLKMRIEIKIIIDLQLNILLKKLFFVLLFKRKILSTHQKVIMISIITINTEESAQEKKRERKRKILID